MTRSLSAAAIALCLIAGSASAQGKGKGHDKDKHEGRRDDDRNQPMIVDNRAQGRVPPGLAKKGGLPPGQAKKMYRATDGVVAMRDVFGRHGYTVVRTEPYGSRQYVYYRRGTGPTQRAIVYPGTDRLTFRNVPQSLVQEILARLY